MKNIYHILLFSVFILCLYTPLALQFTSPSETTSLSENRALQSKPSLHISHPKSHSSWISWTKQSMQSCLKYKSEFGAYFVDQFPFKTEIFSWFRHIKMNLLQADPLPDRVVQGTKDWLFIGDGYSDGILESKGLKAYSKQEVENIIETLQERQKWLKQYDIEYVVVLAPNKSSIYGEYLPIDQAKQPTLREYLHQIMPKSISYIDFGSTLLTKKKQNLVYHKTDSHWNDLGAYYAYQEIVLSLQKKWPSMPLIDSANYPWSQKQVQQLDLSRMLNMNRPEDILSVDWSKNASRIIPTQVDIPSYYKGHKDSYAIRFAGPDSLPKALIFRDSFGTNWMEFLKESLGESLFIWDRTFNKELIEKERPALVIEEIVERELDQWIIGE